MRIAIVAFSRRKIGGTEQNLDVVLPELERRGHRLQFVYFHDENSRRDPIRTAPGTELVHAGELGDAQTLERIRRFAPDLINVHGEMSPAFQTELLAIAPAAYSVHNYYGTCISGLKTTAFPVVQPCHRVFGPACLFHYFPRRCGGKNPLTMMQRYRREREQLEVLQHYDGVITHSAHMEAEYRRHGLNPERIHGLPYEVKTAESLGNVARSSIMDEARLLYVGRMERLKGGRVLIDALPEAARRLRRPVHIQFAGDGPDRARWEAKAHSITRQHPHIRATFSGWIAGDELRRAYAQSHLLTVPSLWPEPFGKVGPEAASAGLPVAAFDVGGIREWLTPGVNGVTAPGNPPTAAGLARAIALCLANQTDYERLSAGARASVHRFDLAAHVDSLLDLFETLCRREKASV